MLWELRGPDKRAGPDYCFDEFSVAVAVAAYPRLAQDDMMTFILGNGSSQLMTLDIEYTTWGNPASEVIYYPSGSCCGPEKKAISASLMIDQEPPKSCPEPRVALVFPTNQVMVHAEIWKDYLEEAWAGRSS